VRVGVHERYVNMHLGDCVSLVMSLPGMCSLYYLECVLYMCSLYVFSICVLYMCSLYVFSICVLYSVASTVATTVQGSEFRCRV
jgi:hypothetical protein